MFNSYENKNVKDKMSKQINILVDYLQQIISSCENINNNYNKIILLVKKTNGKLVRQEIIGDYNYGLSPEKIKHILTNIHDDIYKLYMQLLMYFTRFMDVYFLRRFLDKNYITNTIVYTGAYHSMVYVEILSRDFGFKITHVSYPKNIDVNEINNKIKNLNANELSKIFYPDELLQCSDITHFPNNFL
ncbi:hypothetical protein QJ854_gp845 [Moumouvirus goulette]|uniref:Uncharacterized protein n=1 Tax=Moumouvirus goulette TaxID=1247379 RepID=M1PW34_9VIRU|nr:hypothetical protein QJ854_gp845 [Moumouvirus goulette]AGF84937.1 hypothetical protein glt_00128 [Moumouvirus goulette]